MSNVHHLRSDDDDLEMSEAEVRAYNAAKARYEAENPNGTAWLQLPRLQRLELYRAALTAALEATP